jgi:hypothetical protein
MRGCGSSVYFTVRSYYYIVEKTDWFHHPGRVLFYHVGEMRVRESP